MKIHKIFIRVQWVNLTVIIYDALWLHKLRWCNFDPRSDLLIFQLARKHLLLLMGKLPPSSRGVYLIISLQIKCFLSMLANVWSLRAVGVRSAAWISGELFKLSWINRTCNVNVNMNNCVERHQVKLWLELEADWQRHQVKPGYCIQQIILSKIKIKHI